jgi:hypothetical protein
MLSDRRAILGVLLPWPEENAMADIDEDRPTVKLVSPCRRCRGWLLSPGSVARGIGPTCAARERAEWAEAATERLTLFDIAA